MNISFKSTPNASVAVGFVLVLALMLTLGFVGMNYMARIYRLSAEMVANSGIKIERAHTMKEMLADRSVLMFSIAVQNNSFAQNDEMIAFNRAGATYVRSRNDILALPLDRKERAAIRQVRLREAKTEPLVVQAIRAALAGDGVLARQEIRNQVVPAQRSIARALDQLIRVESADMQGTWQRTAATYHAARLLMLELSVLAALFGMAIAFVVLRNANRQARSLQHQALFDSLTDLPNRVLFLDRLQQAVLVGRRGQQQFSVLAMDLNRFKEINDALGHHAGDQVLQEVARRVRGCLRESDTFARMGGDEFMILLSTAVSAEGAAAVAKKILAALMPPVRLSGRHLEVSASLGIALFPVHGGIADVLLRSADAAMYSAKRQGGGFRIYSTDLDQRADEHVTLQAELREAIETDQLLLHYQPKIDFATSRVSGVEALVRWQHPSRGLLFPDTFIGIAEQSGLIRALTLDVLRKALRQGRTWHQAGLDLSIAVNISALSTQDPEFPDQVADLLGEAGVPGSYLELEITETAVMMGPGRAVDCIRRLNELGVQVAIDDFGTGYSSMTHLKELLVAKIKIDKSFVKDMVVNRNDATIVRSTVELGHSLGLKVIAEGVEGQGTWDQLKALGCDAAQGYYMSRPVPAEQLQKWLQESPWGRRSLPVRP